MTATRLAVTSAIALMAGQASAENFNRIASFMVAQNAPKAAESAAEIIAATGDGMTLVYTDSPAGVVGFIDLTDPAAPVAAGAIALQGEPTSVAVAGTTAYVGENTSASLTDPSGVLHAIDVESRDILATCDLGGQPDAVAISPDGDFVAVAIESERDEDLGDSRVGQMPGGFLTITQTSDAGLDCDSTMRVDLTGRGAISGHVMAEDGTIYAVSDSFYGMQPTIFHIDVSQTPARIVDAIRVTREGQPAQLMDMEGIALDGEGGFWIANEGRSDRLIPHAIFHVGADGAIEDYIPLPPELLAVERRFGFEEISRVGDMLCVAVQREWRDDPANHAKVLGYDLETDAWSVIHYPLTPAETGWVGLSEIVAHGHHVYFIERDNLFEDAATKRITRAALSAMEGMVPVGDTPAVLEPEEVVNLLPYLTSTGGYILDKVEGLAIAEDGTMWVSTDNDSVDDHSGETLFFAIPPL